MMTEFEAFLRTILERPDDDDARLVFADWLDEHGDPRGEFIRIQCALEHLDESDPRREQAETRQWVLTQAHGRQWAGPIPPLVRDYRFRRGFVETVHMLANLFVEHAEELFKAAPIRHAVLYQSAQHIDALAQCGWLTRLRTLDLKPEFSWRQTDYRAIQVDDDRLLTLAHSPHVRNLRKLDLSYNAISDAGLSRLAGTQLVNLTSLDLSHNEIGPDLTAFLNAPQFHDLEELYLGSNQTGNEGARAFGLTRRPAGLRRLRLEANGIDSDGVGTLFAAPCLSVLEQLYLDGNAVTVMSNFPRTNIWSLHTRLETLSLNSTQLGDRGLVGVFYRVRGSCPTHLFLRHNGLSPESIGFLTHTDKAAEPILARFHILDLGDNHLGDQGVQTLAGCDGLAHLKVLDLSSNGIGDDGAQALLASPYLQDIVELSLLDNPIAPDQAARLYQRFGHRLKIDAFEIR